MTDQDPRAEQLKAYFQKLKPECQITIKEKFDEMAWRFYFVVGSKNRYVLDIPTTLLDDCPVNEIIRQLESAKWEATLDEHALKVVTFGAHGFSVRERPKS